jgi:adenylosuccinate synthase
MTFFNRGHGAYFLADGQYGSTGKGLLSSYLHDREASAVSVVASNAGPNSGHTSYLGDRKIVLKQLPTFAVHEQLANPDDPMPIFLTSGAIINPDILNREVHEYGIKQVYLSRQASLISPQDIIAEGSGSVAAVAGTRQGVGTALARKVLRDPTAVVDSYKGGWHPNITLVDSMSLDVTECVAFHEISQGFSLGLNSGFYPKVTSRECTVAQACADARIPPQLVKGVALSFRTLPIRVGNHEGFSSGECYPDQNELSWEDVGVEPELTTVTKRPRRIFSFSRFQYREALLANRPTLIFMNFMNYFKDLDARKVFGEGVMEDARDFLGYEPKFLWGYGPLIKHVSERIE